MKPFRLSHLKKKFVICSLWDAKSIQLEIKLSLFWDMERIIFFMHMTWNLWLISFTGYLALSILCSIWQRKLETQEEIPTLEQCSYIPYFFFGLKSLMSYPREAISGNSFFPVSHPSLEISSPQLLILLCWFNYFIPLDDSSSIFEGPPFLWWITLTHSFPFLWNPIVMQTK